MKPISLIEIAQRLHCKTTAQVTVTGVSVDSRFVKEGELFFALPGAKADGHHYLNEVSLKGAVAAVVSRNYTGSDFGLALLYVDDPLQALQDWAKQIIALRRVRIIAVTGSIGKTTTKEFISTLLSKKYRVWASPGNNNSQIGLPLAILNYTQGNEEILVLEMGMTVPGNITKLINIAPPEVAVLTNVALVHACNFNSLEDIGWAKAEIFSHSQTRLGILPREVVNFDLMSLTSPCHKVSFSTLIAGADYYLNLKNPVKIEAHREKQKIDVQPLPLPGKHNTHNFLAAVAVARYFQIDWKDIISSIATLKLPERRLNFVTYKDINFLNDSYNASELSVKGALETLPDPQKEGKKIAVLGSMMELGKFSADCHNRVGNFALNYVEEAYCLGEECKPIYEAFRKAGKRSELFLDRTALIDHLRKTLKPNDVVLLKGSSSKQLWKVLEEL